jgi:hypothetical protein
MKLKKILIIALSILFLAAIVYAARGRIMTALPNGVWIGPNTDATPSGMTTGEGDLYVSGNIYNESERSFNLPLVAAFLDGTGVIGNDGTTAPGVAETDNIPAIVYASSAEQVKCQWTFRVPSDYSSGLGFRVLMSSSVASPASQSIDWEIWVNDSGTGFDAAAIAQDAVAPTSTALDASNEVVTLTIDATGEAAISAGSFLTIDIWNAGTGDGTTEIKGIQAYYTSTR